MRVLITGSDGFVGAVLAQRLIDRRHEVTGVDSGDRGLNRIHTDIGFQRVERDCREGVLDILAEINHDAIVHLAAGTGSLSRPYEELVELNVEMTKRIYKDAVTARVGAFVFPTTSLALGVPDSPYVTSKEDAMEWLLAQKTATRLIPLRFFNVTGAYKGLTEFRKNEVHIIPTMVQCHLSGKPFIINGNDYNTIDGTPGRDYVNCVDVADFIINELQLYNDDKDRGSYPLPLEVGTGKVTTTLQALQIFNRLVGAVHYEYGPRRPYDCASIQCSQGNLEWALKRPLTDVSASIQQEGKALIDLLTKI